MTKLENDRENEEWANVITVGSSIYDLETIARPKGEHSKHRLIRKRYERQVWVVLALIVAVTLILSR